ncbi:MAG: RAMP superfamily CRISPR-associated protein, partial [Gloeomargarita sp. SKYB31]|nr:RAMP superfamily CRISPR-associated protein [Gloeomargarita sp. SKYB31]
MTNPQYLQRPQRRQAPKQQSGNQGGGNHRGAKGGGGQGNAHPEPSPWLRNDIPRPASSAGFVEYLRWMRAPGTPHEEGTKVKLVHEAVTRADYQARLRQMQERTQRIADETFTVTCPWRIRVGGAKGPESMLLPAFDHLGMPYIPSSTLRGVARAQGMRELMAGGLSRADAENEIAKYLGDLKTPDEHKAGKVIFLDAYPTAQAQSRSGGLAADIANNLWSWEGQQLQYGPNPNIFFSLQNPQFLIGLRRGVNCTDAVFTKVKQWLIEGLAQGAGSQVNTGYGRLLADSQLKNPTEFLRLTFTLEGQLIHGAQTVIWRADRDRYDNRAIAEVRPVAFKSLLRYWFRAFALGVWPAAIVQDWEATLFGSINPQRRGWLRVEILDGQVLRQEARPNRDGKDDPVGQQSGTLVLSLSEECEDSKKEAAQKLFRNLTWLMFHLGGVGQGARRPCYSRRNRDRAPWWRGSQLIPGSQDKFWELPDTAREFAQLMRHRIREFFTALQQVSGRNDINPERPRRCGQVTAQHWV